MSNPNPYDQVIFLQDNIENVIKSMGLNEDRHVFNDLKHRYKELLSNYNRYFCSTENIDYITYEPVNKNGMTVLMMVCKYIKNKTSEVSIGGTTYNCRCKIQKRRHPHYKYSIFPDIKMFNQKNYHIDSRNSTDNMGNTALMYWCSNNLKEDEDCLYFIKSMCSYNYMSNYEKLDLNIQNKNGDTALILACQNLEGKYSIDIIKHMIEQGANPFITNNNGYSALMFFMINSDKDQQKELNNFISERNPEIDYIKHLNNIKLLRFIVDEMENIDSQNISITDKYNRLIGIKESLDIVYQKEKDNLESYVINSVESE